MRLVQGKTTVAASTIHGWGVFALKDMRSGEVVELLPALVVPHEDMAQVEGSYLDRYAYEGPEDQYIVATGACSWLNHKNPANCEYEVHWEDDGDFYVRVFAVKTIKKGQEITINYNGSYNDPTPVNFQ